MENGCKMTQSSLPAVSHKFMNVFPSPLSLVQISQSPLGPSFPLFSRGDTTWSQENMKYDFSFVIALKR